MSQEYVSDYEPLRLAQIISLLEEAASERDVPTGQRIKITHIQNRLCRGVPDAVIPYDRESDAYHAICKISDLYLRFIRNETVQSVDDLAISLYHLMKAK
jgi:hypothetical protein